MNVLLLGPVPTPAVGFLTRSDARRPRHHDLGLPTTPRRTTASSSLAPTASSCRTAPRPRSRPCSTARSSPRPPMEIGRAKRIEEAGGPLRRVRQDHISVPRRPARPQGGDRRRPMAPPNRVAPRGAVGARRRGRADRRLARRHQHQRGLRLDRHRARLPHGGRARRRPRDLPRRRRRPGDGHRRDRSRRRRRPAHGAARDALRPGGAADGPHVGGPP